MSESQPVQQDSLVKGFIGVLKKAAKGRVYRISPWGWVAFLDDQGRQWISYPGRFMVVGPPRPPGQRKDIPDRFFR
jgi:hypothetical protein